MMIIMIIDLTIKFIIDLPIKIMILSYTWLSRMFSKFSKIINK